MTRRGPAGRVVGVVLAVGLTATATAVVATRDGLPEPVRAATADPAVVAPGARPAAPAAPGAPGAPGSGQETRATPVAVGIAAIGVRSRLVGLGLQDDGTVEVPADPDLAGWYDLGPVPGETGSAVVLGHVDSAEGPAVFARLAELRRGAVVTVSLTDGRRVRFEVRRVRTYDNARFPAQQVYGDHGRVQLTLVTCGGEYDADRGGYQSNVVVWAERRQPT